jgi:hypothetical protein
MPDQRIVDALCERFDMNSDEEARDLAFAISSHDLAALTTMSSAGFRDDLKPFAQAFVLGVDVKS